ncbi:23S rRNA (adenine(1618)-N(6))-methyltransferase RlmF [Shewanella cyperi]|uniref:Ribosomal RNA large subunit methyltransferase F n=1 Tax=Shewanella cyperi TaxID=2814292 RepID=A0A975AKT3_9GAMM|nr:23S rRNA (adenine(1618)-N(6))-methyltransferase RlmF [Shewanella cyperi]QSX30061.1 23S rRNA (adenine(1618)-N(6))-methyltransferase RlmF [Shewanella cyperi]
MSINKSRAGKPGQAKGKGLHPRNAHNGGYDFPALCRAEPGLRAFLLTAKSGQSSIDFADPRAVKCLNKALLKQHYGIVGWDIPKGYLCPPVPGRVDYVHYLADLLPKGTPNRVLDIGTGANGIYALLGASLYQWQLVATDIEPRSLANVRDILAYNPLLAERIDLRLQSNPTQIFANVAADDEHFDACMCNPPFHGSQAEASAGSKRKLQNLTGRPVEQVKLNFGGQHNELWCDGGERRFLFAMIDESAARPQLCHWFTSLVSKGDNLRPCKRRLQALGATEVRVIEMTQGNKQTRILAWRF